MDQLREWWQVLAAAIGAVVWLVRIEGKAAANSRDIELLRRQRHEDMAAHKEARDATNEILREIRADIKALMQRNR